MFGLFSKKNDELKVVNQIWISEEAKFKACIALKKSDPNVVFVAWFEEAKQKLQVYFLENNFEEQVHLAEYVNGTQAAHRLLFVEHHPLFSEEQRIAVELELKEITVLSSLSEPFFQIFGGDRLIEMMQKMNVKEDEMIEHTMISNSIKKAQEKIASKIIINSSARSQGEWLQNAGLMDSFL